jgi:NAD(P)-dependent dehydrogenase (short-subunit alcohol dehydrogenase family)
MMLILKKLAKHLRNEHNGLNVLVNNAAIAFKVMKLLKFSHIEPSFMFNFLIEQKAGDKTPVAVQAKELIQTNYTGQVNVSEALFPLLRPSSRVVNVAARVGMLKFTKDEATRNKLKSENLTVQELNAVMNNYVQYLEIYFLKFKRILSFSKFLFFSYKIGTNK